MRRAALVLAKAPVPGLAKTRIAATTGDEAAARLAAAALLDTMEAVEAWVPPGARLMALTGDIAAASGGATIAARLSGWRVVAQRGTGLAQRLICAHHDALEIYGPDTVVVQIAMDTPGITPADLDTLARSIEGDSPPGADCGLGLALDGGWWGLAVRGAGYVTALAGVPMSQPDTARLTAAALRAAGATVRTVHTLRDMDDYGDAVALARAAPASRLAAALGQLGDVTVPAQALAVEVSTV